MTNTIVGTRTRSGRISKVPERLDPIEDIPEDDYSDDDYETESDIESEDEVDLLETDDEDDFEDDDSDMDENGNLKGFVVDDDEDEEA